MGNCGPNRRELYEDLRAKFDRFDFRISHNDSFPYIARATRELTGCFPSGIFMEQLYSAYRHFLIETSIEIIKSGKTPEKGKFVGKFKAPPLVDEMWCLAILYSKKYRELCHELVGGFIDRAPNSAKYHQRISKYIWPDYNANFLHIDEKYIVWFPNRDIEFALTKFYDMIMQKENRDKIHIAKKSIEAELTTLHAYFTTRYSEIIVEPQECERLDSHVYFNREGSISEIYAKVQGLLPKSLEQNIRYKYFLGNKASAFVREYARFMTMIYFSTNTLTPSEEVDQVWHLHQTMTIEYRTFCNKVYGKFIDHTPTTGQEDTPKFSEIYIQTIELYKFIFKLQSPSSIWPTT